MQIYLMVLIMVVQIPHSLPRLLKPHRLPRACQALRIPLQGRIKHLGKALSRLPQTRCGRNTPLMSICTKNTSTCARCPSQLATIIVHHTFLAAQHLLTLLRILHIVAPSLFEDFNLRQLLGHQISNTAERFLKTCTPPWQTSKTIPCSHAAHDLHNLQISHLFQTEVVQI